MQKRTGVSVVCAMFMVALATMFTGAVCLAQTWVPAFEQSEHVQIDPALSSVVPSDRIASAEQQFQQLGKTYNKQFYLVYVKNTGERAPGGGNIAVWKLNQMVEGWQAQPGFSLDHYVVILVMHATTGNGYAAAATGGNDLQAFGLKKEFFNDVTAKEAKAFLPNDPTGFGVAVAKDVNGAIASYHFWHFWLWIYLVIAVVVCSIGGWSFYWFSLKRKVDALIADWNTKANNFTEWYDKLDQNSNGLIEQQQAWIATWTQKDTDGNTSPNETLTKFKEAVKIYVKLTTRKLALSALVEGAEKKRKHVTYPSVGALKQIIASFTTQRLTITGDELPPEKAGVFGKLVEEEQLLPQEICDQMQAQWQQVNTDLTKIAEAFRHTDDDAKAIKGLLKDVDAEHADLEQRNLPLDPYTERQTKLEQRVASVQGDLLHNPLAAEKISAEIRSDVQALKSDITRACALFDALVTTDGAITAAVKKVQGTRGEAVTFAYPFVKGETQPQNLGEQKFALKEENGNPDTHTQAANTAYDSAMTALKAGKLDDAQAQKESADREAAAAEAVVEAVLAAKQYVEKHVTPVRTNLTALTGEIPAAQAVHTDLTAEFLTTNWSAQEHNLATATSVRDTTEGELAKVRVAYHEQRFVAARELLSTLGTDIQSARDGLTAQAARLTELKELRQHAKDVSAKASTLDEALKTKLEANDFTTAQATIDLHTTDSPKVAALATDVAKPITDWPTAAQNADTLLASLEGIDSAIDTQKAASDTAKTRTGELRAAWQSASETVQNDDTTETTKRKYAEATAALQQAQSGMRTAHSNWDAIGRAAELAKGVVAQAVADAESDHRNAAEARAQIVAARTRIREVADNSYAREATVGDDLQNFGTQTSADLSQARSQLRDAEQYLTDQEYIKAAQEARNAQQSADNANQAAINAVTAAITAAVTAYQQEQERQARLQREAEEAEQAAQARANNDDGGNATGGVVSDDSDRTGGTEENMN